MGMDVYGKNPKMMVPKEKFPIYSKYDDMPWGDREKDPKWEKVKDKYWEEMDSYEKSNPGVYFRNNCWWWRPLWQYCKFVSDHYDINLIDDKLFEAGGYNDGAGLDEEGAIQLAFHLDLSIKQGVAKKYADERQQWLDSLDDEPCSLCNNNNRGNHKKKECSRCDGEGTQKDFAHHYPFNIENVQDFALFLEYSGGFSIN